MLRYRVVVWSILASVFVWTGEASAGWIIEQVVKGSGEDGRQQVLLQANRMKTVMHGEEEKPVMAFILDLNANTITQVDYKKRHYSTATLQEFGQMIQRMQQATSDQMAQAMKEMQNTLKDMPPEQRKMMEEMMRSHMPQAGQTPQDCVEPKVEHRKTSQQATIAGYPAVRYDVLIDGKLDSEIWLAKGITAWRELDPKKLERLGAEMAKLSPRCGPAQGRQRLPGDDPALKLAGEGYPVRTVHRDGGDITVEVVKAESRTVPATEFQPPTGFAKKPFREMMGQ